MLLILVLPTSAGVVEDAEEELKKLKEQQKIQRTSPSGQPGQSPGLTPEFTGQNSQARKSTKKKQNNRRTSGSEVSTTSQSSQAGLVELEEPKKKIRDRSSERARKRDKSDRLLSVLGLALLAILIALGAWFGSRGETEV